MLIAMSHEHHGKHIVYSDQEARDAEANGWRRDPELTKILIGQVPDTPTELPGEPKSWKNMNAAERKAYQASKAE